MERSEAQDHLEMVQRIVADSSRKLEVGGEYFIIWGVASAALNVLMQLVIAEVLPPSALWIAGAINLVAVALSILRARANRRLGVSVLQREFLRVLWLTLAMAFFTDMFASHIFTQWALSAIWSVAGAVVLLFIAVHGNRRALFGGIVMLVSIALANVVPSIAGYALAGGMLFGYAGFGALDAFARE